MNILLIGIGIIIVLLLAIWLLQAIGEAFSDSLVGGCTCLLLLAGGILAVLFVINLITNVGSSNQNLAPTDVPPTLQETFPTPTTSFYESIINNIVPCVGLLIGIVAVIAVLYAITIAWSKYTDSQTSDAKVINQKKKNDRVVVGDDGEFVIEVDTTKAQKSHEDKLQFTGSNALKIVTKAFDLEKRLYQVDYRVPAETRMTATITNLETGKSDKVFIYENDVGSVVYNNKNVGRYVLEIELSAKSSAKWSVSFTALK